ncbi:TonB-linked outer membrane protein, SusC/RagA family [Mucilaginibacter gossypiicola]|uniref:TonB-linked outer membrane protein, SusC/RagA family n=1 Tax=Mucilaginibacter gossypiicola TaxID=551995 RepID=A0A1H8BHJ7_9SPHI|nr:TonB-dependent receptor [Mucilaginibacter gossypiicola]SEM81458.1 TonB-linked outer membrane protein, SusC/RagA family [Mucilaginibacter gossypiicola]
MYKKYTALKCGRMSCIAPKLLLIMKLSFFLCLISFMQVSAASMAQKISIDKNNGSLREVLNDIHRQSGYSVFYDVDLIKNARPLTLHVKNASLEDVLKACFTNQPFNYRINQKTIVVIPKPVTASLPQAEKSDQPAPAAQTITGVVTSTKGETLIGVTVKLKGSNVAAVTGTDGKYSIRLTELKGTLVFSYIGYVTKEVDINNQTVINVTLTEQEKSLNDVVVIGYGTQKKASVTGAISSVKGDILTEAPVASIEQGMSGRLSGVQVKQSSGQPGAGISIQIRGAASIAGGNEPLYVIDGLPQFNSDVRTANGLNSINPNDIESIEVLKDAAATSIYGSRAANGVVLVTTKKGKSGSAKVTFDTYFGVQNVRKKLPLMDATAFKAYTTDFINGAANFSAAAKTTYLNELANIGGGVNTDWQNETMRTALNQSYNLGISGGNDNSQYFISANFNDQNGIIKKSDFGRYALRMNLNNKVADWLTIITRSTASRTTENGFVNTDGSNSTGGGANGIGATLLAVPTVPVRNASGSYSKVSPYSFSGPATESPAALLDVLNKTTTYYYQGGIDLVANPIKGLSNTTRLGFNYTNTRGDTYYPSTMVVVTKQSARLAESKKYGYLFEDFLTYTKTFGKLRTETVAGFSAQQDNFSSIILAGTGFPSDQLSDNAIQAATSAAIPVTSITKTTIASFFARTQLDYNSKYLFSASFRRDGASVFSDLHKWANFSSFSGGWRIGEEEFLKNTEVSNLKLRASWGQTGNQAISPYQSLYLATVVNTAQGSGSGVGVGLAPNLANKNLTWETTTQTDIGIDFGIKQDKYRLSLDYYIKDTKDLLATVQLPQSSGFSSISANVGRVQNKGVEVTAGATFVNTKDVSFSVDLNFSKNVNVVKATNRNRDILSDPLNAGNNALTIVRVGQPLFSFYTPHFVGYDSNRFPIYQDVNGDGLINASDNQIAGSSLPNFFYGADFNFKYKSFSLNMTWAGVQGGKINNLTAYQLTLPDVQFNKLSTINNYYPVVSDRFVARESDQFIEDASFFRMKNIRLSYRVPSKILKINNLSFYVSGQNLITFTKYTGYDPEVNAFSGTNNRQGIDYFQYPTAKTITLGLSATF